MTKLSGLLAAAVLIATPVAYAQDGSSCADSIPLAGADSVTTDTTGATNWNTTYGPLLSLSNDVIYTFTANGAVGDITPVSSDYAFAMYLLNACNAGDQPTPIGSTGTIGNGINLAGAGVTDGAQYWLAITGTTAGGAGANGTLNFTTPDPLPVSLQSFSID